ncbi:hypothetical protein ACQWTT_001308 [Acinetobacter baumannii]
MHQSSSNNERKMTLKEYENYIHSIEPLPLELAMNFEKKHNRFNSLYNFHLIFSIAAMNIIFIALIKSDLSLGIVVTALVAAFFLILTYLWFVKFKHYSKSNTQLLPYGLEIDLISTKKLDADYYAFFTMVDNTLLLEKISQFIKYRKDGLLNIDFHALKVQDYFELTQDSVDYRSKLYKKMDQQILENYEKSSG